MRKGALTIAACAMFLALVPDRAHAASAPLLDAGYRDMYNLQFSEAHQAFQQWERLHPQDPLGPVSDAAAYLFSEFNRLHVLQSEFFTDDRNFENRDQLTPDPKARQAFEAELAKSTQVANAVLARDPQNADAQFALALMFGLRGNYAALIEKRNLAGLSYMKQGRAIAERLLAKYPSYYDAYLAVGAENYLLGLRSLPVRWLLRVGGAQTDKESGLQKLRITAERGHYLLPYARLLLAVAALRDKDRERARELLDGLAREFPRNPLYARELAQLH